MDRLAAWQKMRRHYVRTWLVFAACVFVVVDSTHRLIAEDPPASTPWPLVVFLVVTLADVAAYAFSRSRIYRSGQQVEATVLLLALAYAPVTLGLGTAFAGAPTWVLWAALLVALSLATSWAADVRAAKLMPPT